MLIPFKNSSGQMIGTGGKVLSKRFESLSPTAVYSLRQYVDSAPYALRIDVNGVQTDIGFGEEGHAQIAEATNNFAEAANIKMVFDQSGNGHHLIDINRPDAPNNAQYDPLTRSVFFDRSPLRCATIKDAPFNSDHLILVDYLPSQGQYEDGGTNLVGTGGNQNGGFTLSISLVVTGFRFAEWDNTQSGSSNDTLFVDGISVASFNRLLLNTNPNGFLSVENGGDYLGQFNFTNKYSPTNFIGLHVCGNGNGGAGGRFWMRELLIMPKEQKQPIIDWLGQY